MADQAIQRPVLNCSHFKDLNSLVSGEMKLKRQLWIFNLSTEFIIGITISALFIIADNTFAN